MRAVAALGGHTGARIAALLDGSGVTLDPVPIAGETRTCVSIAARDDGRLTEVYEPASPLDEVAWQSMAARVSTLGSGDSYTAGVVVALAEGGSLEAAMRLGAECARANALVPGAGEWRLADLDPAVLPPVSRGR